MARRLIKYVLRTFALAIVVVTGASIWFVLTFDANDYRAVIADAVSRTIDRRVEILGNVEVTPALLPTLAVNRVTIANPTWASRAVMASAGRLEITLALIPLLEGKIQIRDAVLERVDARLERDSTGRGNWELAFLTDTDADTDAEAMRSERYETEIGHVELRDIEVRYVELDGTELESRIDRIALNRRPSGVIVIEGSGRLGELPVELRWEAGPFDERGDDPELRWPVNANVEIGDIGLALTGRLRAPLAYARSEFDLRITGRDGRWWRALVSRSSSEPSTYRVEGHVRIDERSVRVSSLSGELAIGPRAASARLESGRWTLVRGERIEVSLEGSVSGVPWTVSGRLGTFAEIIGEAPWPADLTLMLDQAQLEALGAVSPIAAYASLRIAASGDVLAALQPIVPWALPALGPFDLESQLELEREKASFDEIRLELAPGTITGALSVQRAAGRPSIIADLRARRLDLARLRSATPAAPSARSEPWLDRPLPLDWLGSADAAVTLAIDELRGLPLPFGSLAGRAVLAEGELELSVEEARVAGVSVSGTARLARIGDEARVDLLLRAPSVELDRVLDSLDAPIGLDLAASAERATLEVHARGSSPGAAALASEVTLLTGPLELAVGRDVAPTAVHLSSLRLDAAPGADTRLETNGRVSIVTPGRSREQPFELTATTGTLRELLRAQRSWPGIVVSVASDYLRTPLAVTARIDDPATLLRREPTGVAADARWGPWRANAAATIVPAPGLVESTADVRLDTSDLTAAGAMVGLASLPAGSASLEARVAIGEQRLALAVSALDAPGVQGTGELDLEQGAMTALHGALELNVLDLTPYLARPVSDVGDVDDSATVALHRLYTTQPLVRAPLDRDIEIDIAAESFRVGRFSSRDARLDLAVGDGALDVEAVLDGGQLRSHVRIDTQSGVPEFMLQSSGASVALALERGGEPAVGTPVIDFAATLSGRGQSTQALAESLEGDALVYLRGGRIESGGLRFLFGSALYQLLDVINPFSERQTHIDIECAGAYFEVAGGVVSTEKGIVLQTPELQVIGIGDANLVNGELLMRFRTKRRTGIVVSIGGIVNEFVQLTGTLDAPRVELSPERAARRGALAIATGGLSLIATDLFNRMTSQDVCAELPTIVGAPGTSDEAR